MEGSGVSLLSRNNGALTRTKAPGMSKPGFDNSDSIHWPIGFGLGGTCESPESLPFAEYFIPFAFKGNLSLLEIDVFPGLKQTGMSSLDAGHFVDTLAQTGYRLSEVQRES